MSAWLDLVDSRPTSRYTEEEWLQLLSDALEEIQQETLRKAGRAYTSAADSLDLAIDPDHFRKGGS